MLLESIQTIDNQIFMSTTTQNLNYKKIEYYTTFISEKQKNVCT